MRRLALGVVLTACLPLACAGRSTGPALRNVRMALSTDAITWLHPSGANAWILRRGRTVGGRLGCSGTQ